MKHKKSSDREWGVKMLFNQRGEVLHEGKTLGEALLNIKSKRLESVVLDEQDVYPSKKKSIENKQSGDLKFGMQLEKSRRRAVTRDTMLCLPNEYVDAIIEVAKSTATQQRKGKLSKGRSSRRESSKG